MRHSSRRPRDDARLVHIMRMLERANVECEVELPWGQVVHVRKRDEHGMPKGCPVQFRLFLRNDRPLRQAVTELSLGRAYIQGDLDIAVAGEDEPLQVDGKLSPQEVKENRERLAGNAEAVFDVRDELRSGMSPADLLRLASGFAFASPTRANDRAIRHHYSLGDDFYHSFLDTEYHFYSQCLFRHDDDDLETAAGHKLADMYQRLGLEAGDRILDIGSGWGGLTTYCRELDLDVRVTSLTLSEDSARYIREQVGGEEVLIEDLLEHRRRGYYNHAVIFGVIEHIPTYRQFCARVWDALEPEGRLYLDASATREKYAGSAFTRRYIWRGPHACLAIQDMIEELLFHGFDLLHVHQANDDYSRTMREWALRLELNHARIAERWGEHVYRTFRVFLWGGAHAFSSDRLQAYTLVAERRKEPGPRPGYLRRAGHFVAAMR